VWDLPLGVIHAQRVVSPFITKREDSIPIKSFLLIILGVLKGNLNPKINFLLETNQIRKGNHKEHPFSN